MLAYEIKNGAPALSLGDGALFLEGEHGFSGHPTRTAPDGQSYAEHLAGRQRLGDERTAGPPGKPSSLALRSAISVTPVTVSADGVSVVGRREARE